MAAFNEEFRYGSAAWARLPEIAAAGFFEDRGPLFGYLDQNTIRIDSDAPSITVAGAGAGKLTTVIAYNVCGTRGRNGEWIAPRRLFVNDPRGECAAISIHNHVNLGKEAYCFNPYRLHGLPSLRLNVFDILRPGSLTFEADLKTLINDIITLSGSKQSSYFELRARDWSLGLAKYLIRKHGVLTLCKLYDLINSIEDPLVWAEVGEDMVTCSDIHERRVAMEIHTKRSSATGNEYGSIMGEIFKSFDFLSDPAVYESVSGSDFSLEILCQRDCTVFSMIPAEYVSLLAPLQRVMISAVMLWKQRHPSAPRVDLLIDEAGQLGGNFEGLLRAYTYGRGMSLRIWAFFQDTGQVSRFGPEALSGFFGSSQTRQLFGCRDLSTAEMVSRMLGTQTLEYDATLEQAAARRNKAHIARQILAGADPIESGLNYAQQALAAVNRTKQARALMNPDEILNMGEQYQLIFVSGRGVMPILAHRYPYYTRREMAGAYMPNPYHPPGDRVSIATRFGQKWARVITERVPEKYAHLPQYQSGEWSYIEGYRPN